MVGIPLWGGDVLGGGGTPFLPFDYTCVPEGIEHFGGEEHL